MLLTLLASAALVADCDRPICAPAATVVPQRAIAKNTCNWRSVR